MNNPSQYHVVDSTSVLLKSNSYLVPDGSGRSSNSESSDRSVDTKYRNNKKIWQKMSCPKAENLLVLLTVAGVVLGVALGLGVKEADPSDTTKMLIMFPGEMLMRMLKMLIIPIIVTSIVTGLSNLDVKSSGRMGFHAILYYTLTTTSAVILGIILVVLIHPGKKDYEKAGLDSGLQATQTKVSTLDTFLDLIRNLFPENIVAACFQVTKTTKTEVVNFLDENLTQTQNATIEWKKSKGYSNSTNVLGIIVFFVFFGVMLSRLGEKGKPVAQIFSIFNDIFMGMINIVIWYSPIGICSLIAGNILKLDNISAIVETLGMYIVTVCTGLLIHGIVVLPLIFFVITRKNPFAFYKGVMQAFLTAVGTASSAGTLPITMKCLENNLKIDKRVTQFVVPLGATMNMDGTALLEGVAAITIAQMYGIDLGFGEIVTISVTATFASIGAAAIPSAGLITLILVLTAIGLPADAVGILWSIDWFLDRLRTGLNVLGDCMGAGIVQHLNVEFLESPIPHISREYRRGLDQIPDIELPDIEKGDKTKKSIENNEVVDSGTFMETENETSH